MDFISYLRGLTEGYAHQSTNADFEIRHFLNVEQEIVKLCYQRRLSLEMGLIMAYGHDLGRLKEGVYGKAHSQVSAKIVTGLLKQTDLSNKEVKKICKGIRVHNQKEKIHGLYSELIKDADSLAHGREGIIEREDYFEHIRVLTAELDELKIHVATQQQWIKALESSYLKIEKCLQDDIAFSAKSEFWVHDLRVAIRRMRSILWVLKHKRSAENKEIVKNLDMRLEKMSKLLEYVRILQVAIRKVNLDQSTYKCFQKRIKKIFGVLGQHYDEHFQLGEIKLALDQVIENLPSDLNAPCRILFMQTFRLAKKVDLKNAEKLHKLRIFTKRIKYLMQLGLIQFSMEGVDGSIPELIEKTIIELNDLLGDIHDIYEFETFIKDLSFRDELKILIKEVDKRIFLIKRIGHL